jgi:hypothetical protein
MYECVIKAETRMALCCKLAEIRKCVCVYVCMCASLHAGHIGEYSERQKSNTTILILDLLEANLPLCPFKYGC